MPDTLRLNDGGYMRSRDVHQIIDHLQAMQCVEVVGFSNIGKSALLRLLAQPAVWIQELGEAGQSFLPVYIDCNRMLELSDQGFYELVLRCLQESSDVLAADAELVQAYTRLAASETGFQIPLSFNQGLTAALRAADRRIVLLFDEFDEPFSHIDSRVFLNLRAMKEGHLQQLVYVTATTLPLPSQRADEHGSEFCELFSHRRWHLAPLTRRDQERLIMRYVAAYETPFSALDVDFICAWGGGHPRLLEGICRVLDDALSAAPSNGSDPVARAQFHQATAAQLRADATLRMECEKIWNRCSPSEQRAMTALFKPEAEVDASALDALLRRHILLKTAERVTLFCRLMHEFVQRRALPADPDASSLWVDVQSGEVLIDGSPVETLTNLEYRLMLLLFQHAEQIVDKYAIVAGVWGEEYIDEVDDARIEKLISRLRQKIEPDPSTPRFLTTVRGRGYRLMPS